MSSATFLEHQRLQQADTMIEKRALEFHDRGGDFENRLLALIDGFHQPSRRAQPLLKIVLGLRAGIVVAQHALIVAGETQARRGVLVERNHVLAIQLMDEDVGHDVGGLLLAIIASGLGFQQCYDLGRLEREFGGNPEHLGELSVAMLFKQPEVILHDAGGQRVFHAMIGELAEQALA